MGITRTIWLYIGTSFISREIVFQLTVRRRTRLFSSRLVSSRLRLRPRPSLVTEVYSLISTNPTTNPYVALIMKNDKDVISDELRHVQFNTSFIADGAFMLVVCISTTSCSEDGLPSSSDTMIKGNETAP